MAKKKAKKLEQRKILVMACNKLFETIDITPDGEDLPSPVMLPDTLKEALYSFSEGNIDYTSQDPQDPEAEHDCVYEVTIKKLGSIKNDVHLG